MSVAVEQAHDQALRKPSSLRSVHGFRNKLVESAYQDGDVLAHRERVAQAGNVANVDLPR